MVVRQPLPVDVDDGLEADVCRFIPVSGDVFGSRKDKGRYDKITKRISQGVLSLPSAYTNFSPKEVNMQSKFRKRSLAEIESGVFEEPPAL